jgi:hypothetical protein
VVASSVAAGVFVVLALGALIAGLFGASPIPLPGLPDLGKPAPTQQPAPPQPVVRTTQPPGVTPGVSATPSSSAPTASATPTSPRHVPTQTPTDKGKPSLP